MKSKVILGGTLLVLLGSSVVWAGDPWKEKPYTEWTKKEVKKLLDDSPWMRRFTHKRTSTASPPPLRKKDKSAAEEAEERQQAAIYTQGTSEHAGEVMERRESAEQWRDLRYGMSTTGRKLDTKLKVAVQWLSSNTLRQAIVRYWQLRGKMNEQVAQQFLSPQSDYVVGIRLEKGSLEITTTGPIPAEVVSGMAYLEHVPTEKKILPVAMEKVFNSSLLSPVADYVFYFPRQFDSLGVPNSGDKVKFHCIFPADFEVEFDLAQMMRNGKPDL